MQTVKVEITAQMAQIEWERRECEASLSVFARAAWHVVEPEVRYIHNWHIDVINDHLEALTRRDIRNLVICIPPRHMKSYLGSVFLVAWTWTLHPGRQFLYSSYAQSLSFDHSLKCRQLIESDWYRARWGNILTGDRKQVRVFGTRSNGLRMASSVGGVATGMGGDLAIADDPHNVKERESTKKREGVLDWWDNVISTRGNNPKTFCRLIIMHRVHEADLAGHAIKEGYVLLKLAARFEGEKEIGCLGHIDPRTEIGQPLWEAHYGNEELRDLERHLREYGAAGQLQQRPAPAGGGLLKVSKLRYYSRRIRDTLLSDPGYLEQWVTSWDMSNQLTEDGSYTVGSVWAKRGGDVFLIDQMRERCDMGRRIEMFETLAKRWPRAVPHLVENKSTGPAVVELCASTVPAVELINPTKDKDARAESVSVFFNGGNVWIPHPEDEPWVVEWLEEHEKFPNFPTDDQVDSMSQALEYLYFGVGEAPLFPEGKTFRSDTVQGELPAVEMQLRQTRMADQRARQNRIARRMGWRPQDGTRQLTGQGYDDPFAGMFDDE